MKLLSNWVLPRKLGRINGSSTSFILPRLETEDNHKIASQKRDKIKPLAANIQLF